MLYCFVDTNIFLQFRAFDKEIDWPSVLEANQVCLVIPGIVINELEKHRNHPTSNRLRKRSKSIVKKLEQLALSVSPKDDALVRAETWIRIDPDTPHRAWLIKHSYDPDNPDQVLVGSAQLFKDLNPTENVIVLSDDSGVRLKARNVGLEGRELPDEYRLEDEPDPLQKENQELRQKLMRLESAQPDLKIGFSQDDEIVNEITFNIDFDQGKLSLDEITVLIEERRKKLELDEDFDLGLKAPTEEEKKSLKTMRDYIEGGFTSSETVKKYEALLSSYPKKLENYLEAYQQYLLDRNAFDVKSLRTRQLHFALSNVGTSPAEDIGIELHFPNGLDVIERLSSAPKPPDPPAKPGSKEFYNEIYPYSTLPRNSILPMSPISSNYSGPRPRRGPIIRKTNSYSVKYYESSLKHNYNVILESILLTFDIPNQLPTGFEVSYWIAAANIPDPIEGKLVIRLDKPAED